MSSERAQLHGPWRSNLETVAMAVIMAVFLKAFIVEVYRIPTGSMQPTLFGDRGAGVFDRILVDKLTYARRAPERWEVAVFDYPLNRLKSYIKRVVGVGPEEVRIRRGDLWHRADESEPWRILRRPRGIQDAVLKAIDTRDGEGPSWEVSDTWRVEGRNVFARGDGQAEFLPEKNRIRDWFLDGYPDPLREMIRAKPGSGGANDVADLRVEAWVRALPDSRAVAIELTEGARRYAFAIPGPAAAEGSRPRIQVHEDRAGLADSPLSPEADDGYAESATGEPYRLPAGERVRVRAQNIDDLLELEIDGEWVVALEIPSADDHHAKVYLASQGEGADWEDLMVYRDIYYTSDRAKTASVKIPADHYWMLGDNTQDSSDGRDWIFTRMQAVDENGEELVLRGDTRTGNPGTGGAMLLEGPLTRFEDEWGEVRWFGRDQAQRISPETAPLVHRDRIRGRALAVFWPLNPRTGVYRLGWVN